MASERIGGLVRRLRARQGLTQGQLAEFAKVPRSWLSLVEGDQIRQPDRERLESMAVILKEPPATILAAAGYRTVPLPIRERRPPYEIVRELEAALREAPILVPETRGIVSLGAGAPGEAEMWPYWPRSGERGHEFIAVPVAGNCMEPRIREGERVIVDTTASPRPGDIVVAEREGENLVKMLEQRNGGLWLVGLREQPPIEVTQGVRIVGVVKMVSHRP